MQTIILTTTVFVQDKLYIFQYNPKERINTYLISINKWLNNTDFNILVVDNSGYTFPEFEENDRFQIISFKENELPEATYLLENKSKGASELFAINYSFNNCKFKEKSKYIIKITGRYFIPYFKEYINLYDLNLFDVICQHGMNRCELVGCKKSFFNKLFNISLQQNDGFYCNHIEFLYNERINTFDRIFICKPLEIEPTQQGGINKICTYL
jgi:hypothetical protein